MRLAHRVKELDELPHHLSEMAPIIKVKEWYAQSFQARSLIYLHLLHTHYPLMRDPRAGTRHIPSA